MKIRIKFLLLVLACLTALWAINMAIGQGQMQRPMVFAVIYDRGPAWVEGKPILEQPTIPGHIQHHRNLGEKRIAAAPFTPLPEDMSVGMVVLLAHSQEQAQAWVDNDPAVKSKVMTARLRRWHLESLKGCF